jgi:cobalt-zinc-cadmium resistance protein CzcA
VQGIVLMRKNEHTLPAVLMRKNRLSTFVLDLLHVTRETVRENLLLGMVLVTAVLLMFLSNVRSALIVADARRSGAGSSGRCARRRSGWATWCRCHWP